MTTAGIDFDTHAVHVVLLREDGTAEYRHFPLEGHDAFERVRSVREAMPSRGWWRDEGVVACAIEEPAGKLTGRLFRVQGAILACLPPDLLVEKLMPSQWRKAVGLKGNATKEDVAWFAASYSHGWAPAGMAVLSTWPFDATDAYCLALAVSALWEKAA